jgi:hypothetical protein
MALVEQLARALCAIVVTESADHPSPQFTSRQLIGALSLITILVLVLPVAAWTVHRSRLRRATDDLNRVAAGIRAEPRRWTADILVGPGTLPKVQPNTGWFRGATDSLELALPHTRLVPDPWHNSYVVNIGACSSAAPRRAGWVLSAGANGIIETDRDLPADHATLGGDDVGVRVCE